MIPKRRKVVQLDRVARIHRCLAQVAAEAPEDGSVGYRESTAPYKEANGKSRTAFGVDDKDSPLGTLRRHDKKTRWKSLSTLSGEVVREKFGSDTATLPEERLEVIPFAQQLKNICDDHKKRRTGLAAAYDAIWDSVPGVNKTKGLLELSDDGLVALIYWSGAVMEIQSHASDVRPEFRAAMEELGRRSAGRIAPAAMPAHSVFLRTLIRQIFTLLLEARAQESQHVMSICAHRSDPCWRAGDTREVVFRPGRDGSLPRARARELTNEVLRRWEAICDSPDAIASSRAEDLAPLFDLLLHLAALIDQPALATAVMHWRKFVGAPPISRTYWRLMQVARGTRDQGTASSVARRAWAGYEDLCRTLATTRHMFSRGQHIDHEQYERELWADRIGALIQEDQVTLATQAFEQICTGQLASAGPDDIARIIGRACVFHPTQVVPDNIHTFLAACQELPSTRPYVCSAPLLDYIIKRMLRTKSVASRLDELHRVMLFAIQHCSSDHSFFAKEVRNAHTDVIDCLVAAAFSPRVESDQARMHVESAYIIFSSFIHKFGFPNKYFLYVLQMVDALALVGMHDDAVATARTFVHSHLREENAGETASMSGRKEGLLILGHQLLEAALGLDIQGASPSLQNLLDAGATLIDLQSTDDLAISASIQQAVKQAVSMHTPDELVELIKGENARVVHGISQATVVQFTARNVKRKLYSRAPGRQLTDDDDIYGNSTEKFWSPAEVHTRGLEDGSLE